MKRTKKLLSFFLAIVMVITAFAAVPFTTNAANFNGTLTNTGAYIIYNSLSGTRTGTYGTGSINICNDGGSNNFCAGWWGFSIEDVPASIGSINATISIEIPEANSGNTGVNIYATDYSINANKTVSGSGATARNNALDAFTPKKLLGTYTSTSTGTFNANISDAVKAAKEEGWTNFNIFAVQSGVGSGSSNNKWTDTWLKVPVITINATEKINSTTISKENNENSVINRIVLDDAIYTYQSETAYYNYGTVISDLDPWDTKVVFKNGASRSDLRSITCVDSGATLSLNGTEKLTGNLLSDKFKVSGNTDVNATLKFTFNDGAVEYHRVAVKSYPVENHISACAEKDPGWGGTHTETGYTMFMRGSTGSGGSGVWKYQKSYYTSGTSSHGFPDQNSNTLTADKNAFIFGYGYNAEAATNVSLATYYIDKSCKDTQWAGLGNSELWNGNNYNITIDVVRTRFSYDSGTANWNNRVQMVPTNNYSYSAGQRSDTNGTTYPLTYSYNSSVTTSNRYTPTNTNDNSCNVRVALQTTDKGYAVLRTNMVVNLFDKSTARTAYNNEIKDRTALKETDYTASSFATYQNALLNLESYLSNYEDTDTSKMTSLVNSLNTAKSNLVKRGNTQAVLNKLNEYNSVTSNQSKYTPSSYNSFINEAFQSTDPNLASAINLGRDTYAQRDLTEAQESAYLTSLQNILNILKLRADFTAYNTALNKATNSTDGYLIPYKASSVATLPTYTALQKYNGITIYTNQNNIDDSYQTEINAAANALVAANTAVYTDTIDQTTLQAFVSHIATFDKDVYDEAAVNTVKSNINAIYKTVSFNGVDYYSLDVASQDDYDSRLRGFINSFNSSLDKYSVSVSSNVTVKVNGITQSPNAKTGKYEFVYGTKVEFSAPTADTAWYMNYNSESASRTQQFQKYAQTYTATIIGNMTIDARTKSDATPYRVTVERDYGVEGMTNGMAFVDYTAGGNYTLPTMPNHPYYSFDGYYVGGTKLDSNTVNITGNTTVIAKYVKNGSDLTVNVNGTISPYAYNSKVTISEPGAYAWVEKVNGTADTWRPFYIGSGCTFRVTESIELKPVTKDEFNSMFADKEAFAPNTRQSGAIADPSTNKATINAQRVDYLPQGAQITEYGILVAKDARTDDFNLENTNEKSIRAKSTKLISGNQFSIGLTNLANTNFTYRSYMIYQVPLTDESGNVTSWETKTVYSEIMTYSGATV